MCFHWILSLSLFFHSISAQIHHSKEEITKVKIYQDYVILGTVNKLYLLAKSDFSLLNSIDIGPVVDSPLCSYDGKSCLKEAKREKTDNYVKILEVLEGKVLLCGTVRQGICNLFTIPDLTVDSIGEVPISANHANVSTVSLFHSGHLYVAVSASAASPYRDPFPAVAIREPPELHILNSGSLEGEAAVYIREEYRHSFTVTYIKMFNYQHFIYLLAVQPKTTNRNAVSGTKLIRFCKGDKRFTSYSEIELQCRTEDNTNYPILTDAFIKGNRIVASFSDSSFLHSVICVFSLDRIQLTYWYNMDRCHSGTDTIGLPHIGRDSKCINKSRIVLDEDSCDIGVGGNIEAVEVALKEFQGQRVTSITSFGTSIVIAATDKAEIIMMKWKDNQLEEYSRRLVGSEPIRQLSIVDDRLLLQQKHSIEFTELSSCSSFSNCTSCLQGLDPLCQWCFSKGKCINPVKCPDRVTAAFCPLTNGLPEPSKISIDFKDKVFVPVKNLMKPENFTYECVFGSVLTDASFTDTGISCSAPSGVSLNTTSQSMELSIRTSLSTAYIVSQQITLYDCAKIETCSACMSSEFNCNWCSQSFSCVSKNSCKGPVSTECVHIGEISSIRIPFTNPSSISLPLINVDQLSINNLKCSVYWKGANYHSNAISIKERVICDPIIISNKEKIPNTTVQLSIRNRGRIVDHTNITLYDCSLMASDCSSCKVIPLVYGCEWCHGSCSHQCNGKEEQICDRPVIQRIEPVSGPIEGGTVLSIYGRDLGSSLEDVQDRIFVASSRCNLLHYETSKKIVCKVEKGSSSGPVTIAIGKNEKLIAKSTALYSFTKVQFTSAYPLSAPISGGSKLTLYGQNLNIGSNVTISVGKVPCVPLKRNSSSSLTCILSASNFIGKVDKIELSIDSSIKSIDTLFEFRPDPYITAVYPLLSTKSGGRTIYVQGSHLDTASSRMFLISPTVIPSEIVSEASECSRLNSTMITCSSPRILHSHYTDSKYARYWIGFLMDNVTSVRNLGERLSMKVVPDPEFAPFKGIRVHYGEQSLILDGIHLNDAYYPEDYKIFIGSEKCEVTVLDFRQLVCSAPFEQPKPTDSQGNSIADGLPLVTVFIGQLKYELGLIQYHTPITSFKLWALILSCICAFLVILIVLVLMWKTRKSERERDYKKIQLQMEHLESNVRKECKQAFAELQTTMISDGTVELEGVEGYSLQEFCNRLFWTDSSKGYNTLYITTLPITLAQFDSLIMTKQFIYALVECIDSDSSISSTEKSHISSLLSSILVKNFHYFTEIVTNLLRAHIAKTVKSSSSELLFRKSESLVEKLVTKWLTIALYEHIQNEQAPKLYQLYTALKMQTERGSVDVVTGCAKYTLNESKLLRETIDETSVTCHVMDIASTGPHLVSFNSTDALLQMKQKIVDCIYKNIVFSQRPTTNTFNIEIRCPRRGTILLSEMDKFGTKGHKRLCTVGSYGISNGALLFMVHCAESNRDSFGDSGQSSLSSDCYSTYTDCYHLTIKRNEEKKKKIDENIPSSIPEVYLTRLLTSKGTVQSFIDEFLESVLFVERSEYPNALKFIFNILDEEAVKLRIEPFIVQQWKGNLYALRIWANLITNPTFLFDIEKRNYVEPNLTVIAQTLSDCFSVSEPIFLASAPSSRLLFAKEISRLRPLASDLLRRIQRQPVQSISQDITNISRELSDSKSTTSLSELLCWIRGNGLRLLDVLCSNEDCKAQRLPQRLSQIMNLSIEQEHIYSTISEYSN